MLEAVAGEVFRRNCRKKGFRNSEIWQRVQSLRVCGNRFRLIMSRWYLGVNEPCDLENMQINARKHIKYVETSREHVDKLAKTCKMYRNIAKT